MNGSFCDTAFGPCGRGVFSGGGSGGGGTPSSTQEVTQIVVPNSTLLRSQLHGTYFVLPSPSGAVNVYLDFGACPSRLHGDLSSSWTPSNVQAHGNVPLVFTVNGYSFTVTLYSGSSSSGDVDVDVLSGAADVVNAVVAFINSNHAMSVTAITSGTGYFTLLSVATGSSVPAASFSDSPIGSSLTSDPGEDSLTVSSPDLRVLLGTNVDTWWSTSNFTEVANTITYEVDTDERYFATASGLAITVTNASAGACDPHGSAGTAGTYGFSVSTVTNGS